MIEHRFDDSFLHRASQSERVLGKLLATAGVREQAEIKLHLLEEDPSRRLLERVELQAHWHRKSLENRCPQRDGEEHLLTFIDGKKRCLWCRTDLG